MSPTDPTEAHPNPLSSGDFASAPESTDATASAEPAETAARGSKAKKARPPRQPPASGRAWLVAAAVGLLCVVLSYLVIPNSGGASFDLRGDPELAESVEHALDGREGLVQGMVALRQGADGESEVVSGGTIDGRIEPDADTPFETGSIFKVITAMTLADMVENGETDLDRSLGDIFPDVDFADADVAEVTLVELATHTSGLMEIPAESTLSGTYQSMVALDLFRDLPDPTESLATTELVEPGEWTYSNFGYAVLGHALDRESGTEYSELVRERVLDPLEMDATHVLGGDIDAPPVGAASPHVERGAPAQTWAASEYAAAGAGTWTTAEDLMRLLTAVRDGTAPGMASLEPAWSDNEDFDFEHGLGWWIYAISDGEDVLGHGGTTNGSMAFMGLRGDTAVVALSNTFLIDMAPIAATALGVEDLPPALRGLPTNYPSLISQTLAMALVPALLTITLMLRRKTLIGQRPLDRLRIISMPLGAAAVLLGALRMGSWAAVAPIVWALAFGVAAAALVVGVSLWPHTPTVRARFRWLRLTCFTLSVTLSVVFGAAMIWTLGASYLS